jgi:hypothetical protein
MAKYKKYSYEQARFIPITTIADFVSSMETEVLGLFRDVLMICDEMKLIGKDMFAIDGCKMPSNASKEWSGTKAELKKKKQKMERAVRRILKKHRETDIEEKDIDVVEKEKQYINMLKIHRFGPGFT